jgi:hypothetical protein
MKMEEESYQRKFGSSTLVTYSTVNNGVAPLVQYTCCILHIGGHRHLPLYQRYPTSNIDTSYSDMIKKHAVLNFLFLYRKGVPISTSESIPLSDIKTFFFSIVLHKIIIYTF